MYTSGHTGGESEAGENLGGRQKLLSHAGKQSITHCMLNSSMARKPKIATKVFPPKFLFVFDGPMWD